MRSPYTHAHDRPIPSSYSRVFYRFLNFGFLQGYLFLGSMMIRIGIGMRADQDWDFKIFR